MWFPHSRAHRTSDSTPRQGLIRFEGEFYAEGCHAVSSIDDYRLAMGGNGAGIYNGRGGQIVFKQAVEMLFCGNWVSTGIRDVCVHARLNFVWPCCSTTACGILRMFLRAVQIRLGFVGVLVSHAAWPMACSDRRPLA